MRTLLQGSAPLLSQRELDPPLDTAGPGRQEERGRNVSNGVAPGSHPIPMRDSEARAAC